MANRTRATTSVPKHRLWALAGGIGLLFTVVAGADNVLTWFPTDFGNREWEFGTVTASFNGLLSIVLGLGLIQLWMAQLERGWPLRVLGVVHILLGILVLAAALLYWTNVPVAWDAVPDSPVRAGLLKAIIKTSVQSVAYPIAFFLLARSAFVWAGQIARAVAGASKSSSRVGILERS